MMKSFSVLFAVLSIINFPLYYSYYKSTSNNNMSINEVWRYFTIGNIGNTDNTCGWTNIDLDILDNKVEDISF